MAKVTFTRFKCDVDTNEWGSESPYFLTWVGNVQTNTSALKYTRKAFWENKVDPGPWWPVNDTVVANFDLSPDHTLALTLMIEEDEGVDLTFAEATDNNANNALKSVRETMAALLNVHNQNGSNIQAANVVSNFRLTLAGAAKKFLQNANGASDDLMESAPGNAAKVIQLQHAPAVLTQVTYRDDGDGKYLAEFTVSA